MGVATPLLYIGVDPLQHETIFACRLQSSDHPGREAASLTADDISAARWWSLSDLAACSDEVWPYGLVDHTRKLLRGDLNPAVPRELEYR